MDQVRVAVAAELDRLPAATRSGWRATLARTLAVALDDVPNASMARELRALMHEIVDGVEPEEVGVADDLRARRAARIADSAAV